jgi:hypothetical protein
MYMSPFPNILPDAEGFQMPEGNSINFDTAIDQIEGFLGSAQHMLSEFKEARRL